MVSETLNQGQKYETKNQTNLGELLVTKNQTAYHLVYGGLDSQKPSKLLN